MHVSWIETSIGSDVYCQLETLRVNFSEILMKMQRCSYQTITLKFRLQNISHMVPASMS